MKIAFKKLLDCLVILGLFGLSQLALLPMVHWLRTQKSLLLVQSFLILLLQLLTLIIFIAFTKRQKLLTFTRKSWFSLKTSIYVPIGYTTIIILNLLGALILLFEGQETTVNQSSINELFKPSTGLVMFVFIVILAPLTEEVIFRGLFPRLFSKKLAWLGYGLGVLLFGLAHGPSNIGSSVIYFGMGSVLAVVAYLSKKLEYSVLLHMLNNGLAFIIMLFQK